MPLSVFERRHAVKAVVGDPETFATTLVVMLADTAGTEAFSWGPETIRRELYLAFGAELSSRNEDRLLAGVTLVTTDAFYKDARRFVDLVHALAGNGVPLETFEPPSVAECCWAVAEAALLHPTPKEAFLPAIRAYLRTTLTDEGFLTEPAILDGIAYPPPVSMNVSLASLTRGTNPAQEQQTREIQTMIARNMHELAAQLASLPLEHGDPAVLQQRLTTFLGSR